MKKRIGQRKSLFLLLLSLLLPPLIVQTQAGPLSTSKRADITVTGTVSDEAGETLPGVTVRLKGAVGVGVTTNTSGKYSIRVPESGTLEFTYVGYEKVELPVRSRILIDVVLKSNVETLNEVVVLGYGSIAKSDYNGSSSTVRLSNVNQNRVVTVSEALQGKMAGVQINNNSGEPGGGMTFNIRGLTSVTGSNQPLIVLDGQPIETSFGSTLAGSNLDGGAVIPASDPLAAINPSDIASIEVLKDASSTAIYGSRGANGVVLITTKSGKSGGDKISYISRVDFSTIPKKLDVLTSNEYAGFRNESLLNDGKLVQFSQFQLDSIANTTPVNWQDLVYRTAIAQDHQLSLSGRDPNNKSNYYITGNYTDQPSVIRKAGFKRYGLRLNYERKVNERLSATIRSYYSYQDRDFGQQSNKEGIFGSSAVAGAIAFNPLNSPFKEDGTIDEALANNPVVVLNKVLDDTGIRSLTTNAALEYKISKKLSYRLSAGINDILTKRLVFYPTGTFIGNTAPNGAATKADNANTNYVVDNILTYKNTFAKKHSLNVVGVYSFQTFKGNASSITNLDFPSNTLTYNNFASANALGRTYTSNYTRKLASYIGRMNYAYDKRYTLTLTGRADGSSLLAPGNKWKFFPSAGLGWNVSNEKFWKEKWLMSSLKLRTSVGVAGNNNIGVGASQSTYAINNVVVGGAITPGYIINSFGNADLGWENTTQYNAGMDIGFMSEKLVFTVDLYKKITTDLLIAAPLPGSSGFGSYDTNVGEVHNKGIDIEGNYQILNTRDFSWTASANISFYDNKVKDIGPSGLVIGTGYVSAGAIVLGQGIQVAKPGYPISSFWGYKTNGIYQNQAEINADPGLANDNTRSTIKPGDLKYTDTNNDGQITDADKTIIGNPTANFGYGISTNLTYKRFSLAITTLGSYGGQLINLNRWVVGANNSNGNFNSLRDVYEGRWTGEGTSNKWPRLTSETVRMRQRFPDLFVENSSFFRLQNVNLGYTFKLPKALKVSSLKAYVSGTNLFTITDYTGYDPNVNAFGGRALMSGTDFGTLPQPRTFSGGIELTF